MKQMNVATYRLDDTLDIHGYVVAGGVITDEWRVIHSERPEEAQGEEVARPATHIPEPDKSIWRRVYQDAEAAIVASYPPGVRGHNVQTITYTPYPSLVGNSTPELAVVWTPVGGMLPDQRTKWDCPATGANGLSAKTWGELLTWEGSYEG